MGPTVRTILMTALAISVLMEGPVWMELTPTTANVLQSGLVRDLCSCLFVCSSQIQCVRLMQFLLQPPKNPSVCIKQNLPCTLVVHKLEFCHPSF